MTVSELNQLIIEAQALKNKAGQVQYPVSLRKEVARAFNLQSDLSLGDFAKKLGVTAANLRYWVDTYAPKASPEKMLPLSVSKSPATIAPDSTGLAKKALPSLSLATCLVIVSPVGELSRVLAQLGMGA
jgi:hypothetical protein